MPPTIALELFTVRQDLAENFEGTLQAVAQMGYPAVEWAGDAGKSEQTWEQVLRQTGLEMAGMHVRLPALENNLDAEIARCQAFGCHDLIIAYLSEEERGNPDQLAHKLNEIGRQTLAQNIHLGYHNHDFEFEQVNGETFLARLMALTPPELVSLELDVYWAAYAGHDPVELIKRYDKRIRLLHLKDMSQERTFTEVGAGTLDMKAIIATAEQGGTQYFVVENDRPSIPALESARISLQNLKAMGV